MTATATPSRLGVPARFFLAAVVAVGLLIGGAVTASAASSPAAENVVGASTVTLAPVVGPTGDVSPGNSRETYDSQAVSASATGVAADSAMPGIKPGSAGGPTAGDAFPQSVRADALAENPSTCVYCRMETDAPQVDHSIPRVANGNATIDNAQTTCPWCNASKGPREFPVNPPPGYQGTWPPPWWNNRP